MEFQGYPDVLRNAHIRPSMRTLQHAPFSSAREGWAPLRRSGNPGSVNVAACLHNFNVKMMENQVDKKMKSQMEAGTKEVGIRIVCRELFTWNRV